MLEVECCLDADWAQQDTRLTSRVLPAQSASWVTVQHRMNVPDSLYPTWFLIGAASQSEARGQNSW